MRLRQARKIIKRLNENWERRLLFDSKTHFTFADVADWVLWKMQKDGICESMAGFASLDTVSCYHKSAIIEYYFNNRRWRFYRQVKALRYASRRNKYVKLSARRTPPRASLYKN